MAETDLSEEQIQQLLKDAELRLATNPHEETHQASFIPNLKDSISTIAHANSIEPYINGIKIIPKVHITHLYSKEQERCANEIRKVNDPIEIKRQISAEKKASAGPDWYNLPRTNLTPEFKRDLHLLQMRDVLDPKRHYKKDSTRKKVPEFSQVGTLIEGPTEYYSGRLTKKERKRTLVEEILENESATSRFKRKYNEIQAVKTSGKRAYYKKMRSMRSKNGISKR